MCETFIKEMTVGGDALLVEFGGQRFGRHTVRRPGLSAQVALARPVRQPHRKHVRSALQGRSRLVFFLLLTSWEYFFWNLAS